MTYVTAVSMKILMVCLGNICRSPMAEGIMREKLKDLYPGSIIDSAGTGGWHAGENPDRRAVKNMNDHGIDISKLVARQFHPKDFENFDLILAMDESNYEDILKISNNEEQNNKVKLILSYMPGQKTLSVPDPWYGGPEGFEHVFHLLNDALDKVILKHFKDAGR